MLPLQFIVTYMLIGVDGNEANVTEKVGVSVYTLKLLHYFQKKSAEDLSFIIFLKTKPNQDMPQVHPQFNYQIVPGNFLWSQTFLPIELYKQKFLGNKIDVFFSPAHYIPRFSPAPLVVTIHDLSYFYYPDEFLKKDLYQLKNWTKYSAEKAKKIIAVSNTTKKDIVRFYQTPEEKIEVVYNGYEKTSNIKHLASNSSIEKVEPYILYVGTIQPRKNIGTLIEAFAKFKTAHPELKLVIAGKKGWLYEETFIKVKKMNLEKHVRFLGFVDDPTLISLYKHAFWFVLPSFYEGFGIPVLEAMSYGCPVISSFTASLPEIAGDAALYIDPEKKEDIVDKLNQLLENKTLRNELITKGKERSRKFSWKTCGEKTLEVLIKTCRI